METKVSADAAVASIELGHILLEDVRHVEYDEFEIETDSDTPYLHMGDHESIRECGFNIIGVSTHFESVKVEYTGDGAEDIAYYNGEHAEVGEAFSTIKPMFGDSIEHRHGPRFAIDLESTWCTPTRLETIRNLGFKIYTTDFEDNELLLAHPQDYVPPEEDEE